MFDTKFFDQIARQLASYLPASLNSFKEDIERNFTTALQTFFANRLVTRDEFDIQVKLLQKAREKIDELEADLRRLEAAE